MQKSASDNIQPSVKTSESNIYRIDRILKTMWISNEMQKLYYYYAALYRIIAVVLFMVISCLLQCYSEISVIFKCTGNEIKYYTSKIKTVTYS